MNLGKRIMIIGPAGSGKSTLAVQLGEALGLPVVHLDRLFWQPGWVQTPKDEMGKKATEAASGDEWIIDGNFSSAMDLRMERASCVIFIDFNRYLCIFRVINRWLKTRGKTRPDMAEGCPEKIDMEFLSWIWNWPKKSRPHLLEKIERLKGTKTVFHFRRRKEIERFLQNLHNA